MILSAQFLVNLQAILKIEKFCAIKMIELCFLFTYMQTILKIEKLGKAENPVNSPLFPFPEPTAVMVLSLVHVLRKGLAFWKTIVSLLHSWAAPCILSGYGSQKVLPKLALVSANSFCIFSIFSTPYLFASFTTQTGSEPACITFQFSGPHHAFRNLKKKQNAHQVKGFIFVVHVLCLQNLCVFLNRHAGSIIAFVAFLSSVPPTCLPCLLHPPGSNYVCNFSIFSIPHLSACFTIHTGSEPAWNCMYYLSLFGAPPPIYMASDFSLDRFCKESTGLQRHETSNQKEENEIQHPAPIPRLKTFEERRLLKEQHAKKMQKRNPGPRSNETNCICSMHPESKFSCVRFMFRTFKLFAWFRHTYGVKKCICCFSIFSTPHLFALFVASPGFKQSLQLFYL